MLRVFNTLGKRLEIFKPANRQSVDVFTCGPSVYQKAHIGNFRTFLFEDILVRYLEYSGFRVKRGMNITDIEDKAFEEAKKQGNMMAPISDADFNKIAGTCKMSGNTATFVNKKGEKMLFTLEPEGWKMDATIANSMVDGIINSVKL